MNVTKEHRQAIYYVSLLSNSHQLTPRTLRCPLRDDIQKLCPIAARSQLWPAAPKRRVRDPRSRTSFLSLFQPRVQPFSFAALHYKRQGYGAMFREEAMSRDTAAGCSQASIASELHAPPQSPGGRRSHRPLCPQEPRQQTLNHLCSCSFPAL